MITGATRVLDLFAAGIPRTKGSARAFVRGGKAVVVNDCRGAKSWQLAIAAIARAHYGSEVPLSDAVGVSLKFDVPRPKAHFDAKWNRRPGAPTWCSKRPDLDKYTRLALDALTGIVWRDDGQVAHLEARKVYADALPGVSIQVWRVYAGEE